jgi:hypothetical protein
LAIPENGRPRDVAHDEQTSCQRTPPPEPLIRPPKAKFVFRKMRP